MGTIANKFENNFPKLSEVHSRLIYHSTGRNRRCYFSALVTNASRTSYLTGSYLPTHCYPSVPPWQAKQRLKNTSTKFYWDWLCIKLTINQSTLEAMEIRWKNRPKDRLLLGFTASVAEVQKYTLTHTTAGREDYSTECWRREEEETWAGIFAASEKHRKELKCGWSHSYVDFYIKWVLRIYNIIFCGILFVCWTFPLLWMKVRERFIISTYYLRSKPVNAEEMKYPPCLWNPVRADVTKSPKQGYQWPQIGILFPKNV